jgi:hypothetical protein
MPAETFIITVANVGQPGDRLCEALRVQQLAKELARRLGLAVLEVKVEQPQERRERRARQQNVGGYNTPGRR